MGKLLLESYTRGQPWLAALTEQQFTSFCDALIPLLANQYIVLLTHEGRREELLQGTKPLYGLSYHFRYGVHDEQEFHTNDDLWREPKILVIDDLALVTEGLAHDDGKKLHTIFTYLLQTYALPHHVGLQLQYYKINKKEFLQQLVLPVQKDDLIYMLTPHKT